MKKRRIKILEIYFNIFLNYLASFSRLYTAEQNEISGMIKLACDCRLHQPAIDICLVQ